MSVISASRGAVWSDHAAGVCTRWQLRPALHSLEQAYDWAANPEEVGRRLGPHRYRAYVLWNPR
jgi:hypothetical protein